LQLLNPLFETVQVIKRTENKVTLKLERVLQEAGSRTNGEAEAVRKTTHDAFDQVEREW
jgi:ElaB/YqjD/DUF883 family membrane-anchored ribosome-binding protein